MDSVRQKGDVISQSAPSGPGFWPTFEGGPFLFHDVTMLIFSVTFRPDFVARTLPSDLKVSEGATGGFEFLIARRGHLPVPFSATTIWFDLASPCGDLVAPRFAAARFASHSLAGDPGVVVAQTRFCEDVQLMSAELALQGRSILRAALLRRRSGFPAAGVTTYLGGKLQHGAWQVVPWAATLWDAEVGELEVLAPSFAEFTPLTVFGATLGTEAALTLGIASRTA